MSIRTFYLLGFVWASSAGAAEDHTHHAPAPEHAQHRAEPAAAHHDHATHADEPTESERAHVPPDPPTFVLGAMSMERMNELMQMDDDASYWMVKFDELEAVRRDGDVGFGWELDAWLGGDYDKVWLKFDGERFDGRTESRAELAWDRIVSPWWSLQVGVRRDELRGPSRTWGMFGVRGHAPYDIEVEASLYAAEGGRTALRVEAETDWLLTQRLVLQPSIELAAYGKDDVRNGIGSGVSEVEIGLRLRYEIVREFAPYLGVQWERKTGASADLARAAGDDPGEFSVVAGVRIWF
jgi:copper resistance protein B